MQSFSSRWKLTLVDHVRNDKMQDARYLWLSVEHSFVLMDEGGDGGVDK